MRGLCEPYNLSIYPLHIIGHGSTVYRKQSSGIDQLINKVKGTEITGITVVQLLQVLPVMQEPET